MTLQPKHNTVLQAVIQDYTDNPLYVAMQAPVIPMFAEQRQTVTTKAKQAKVKKLIQFDTIEELIQHFENEELCILYFIAERWGKNGIVDLEKDITCPYCSHKKEHNATRVSKYENEYRWKCNDCERPFSYTVGTTFQNTKITLKKWFIAIFMFNAGPCTPADIQGQCKVTEKTAIKVLRKIYGAVMNANDRFIFDQKSTIEADESADKAPNSNKHNNKKDAYANGRAILIGTKIWYLLYNRKTKKIKLFHLPTTHKNYLIGIIKMYVVKGATVNTDKYHGYDELQAEGYKHFSVDHSIGEWSNGDIYTNNGEREFAETKREIHGTHIQVSYKYTQMYLNGKVHRHNLKQAKNQYKLDYVLCEGNGNYNTAWEIEHDLAA